ncbi:MAG: hypothetical protein BWY21_00999 [Parcubacteria group bacterium ADurb.Bin216]|nr:MAG: hypothetical protein BWY21_00999 [Parcubacteria group bacterium ADurb.Bin216]
MTIINIKPGESVYVVKEQITCFQLKLETVRFFPHKEAEVLRVRLVCGATYILANNAREIYDRLIELLEIKEYR